MVIKVRLKRRKISSKLRAAAIPNLKRESKIKRKTKSGESF